MEFSRSGHRTSRKQTYLYKKTDRGLYRSHLERIESAISECSHSAQCRKVYVFQHKTKIYVNLLLLKSIFRYDLHLAMNYIYLHTKFRLRITAKGNKIYQLTVSKGRGGKKDRITKTFFYDSYNSKY